MRRFDVVSTISQRMHQRLLDKGVAISAITPGGHGLPRCARDDGFRAELGIAPGAVVALYSGNMGGKQGLELLADVAKLCLAQTAPAQAAIVFVFCGNGTGHVRRSDVGAGLLEFLLFRASRPSGSLIRSCITATWAVRSCICSSSGHSILINSSFCPWLRRVRPGRLRTARITTYLLFHGSLKSYNK